jgi:hypothetical protein
MDQFDQDGENKVWERRGENPEGERKCGVIIKPD